MRSDGSVLCERRFSNVQTHYSLVVLGLANVGKVEEEFALDAVVRRAVRVGQERRRDVRREAEQLCYERASARGQAKQGLPAYVVLRDEVVPGGIGRHVVALDLL